MSEKGILKDLRRCARTSERYESGWERDYMKLLDDDPLVKRWERCRSLKIPYTKSDGSRGTYNPDFIVERTDGTKELHEVKGGHLIGQEDTKRKLAAGKEYCQKRKMVFRVITKRN